MYRPWQTQWHVQINLLICIIGPCRYPGYFWLLSRTQCNQSFLGSQGNGFGAIGSSELAHDRTDVELGSTFTDHKLSRNFLVWHALGQQVEHFKFALGE